jgi:hypothetical protein
MNELTPEKEFIGNQRKGGTYVSKPGKNTNLTPKHCTSFILHKTLLKSNLHKSKD